MKIRGIIAENKFLFSRAQHDFRSYKDYSVDGGFLYLRYLYKDKIPQVVYVELKNVTSAELYNDWNYKIDKYGIHDLQQVTILESNEYPNIDSFEYRKENAIWGTYGKDGKSKLKYINLISAETDHLNAILNTQKLLSPHTREIINSILKDRACGSLTPH